MCYRIVENHHITDSVPEKNKIKKLAFFLNGAWFTLTRNTRSQNNRYGCYKNPMQFMKFLYITLKWIRGHNMHA
jgi:hypothetical protein